MPSHDLNVAFRNAYQLREQRYHSIVGFSTLRGRSDSDLEQAIVANLNRVALRLRDDSYLQVHSSLIILSVGKDAAVNEYRLTGHEVAGVGREVDQK